jgi:AhpD family alkylhydroperoxidase
MTEENEKRLPRHYVSLRSEYPKVCAALEGLGTAVREAGPLDLKTGHLVQLAGAATNRSEGSVHSHVRRAIEAGATREEVRHAVILLSSTIGFPAVAATLSWIDEVLDKS